jgi:hypothetical protein
VSKISKETKSKVEAAISAVYDYIESGDIQHSLDTISDSIDSCDRRKLEALTALQTAMEAVIND